MEALAAEEGIDFSYLVVLFEGNGAPASGGDAKVWADTAGLTTPVLADPTGRITELMPFGGKIPARCALTPRMELMGCYSDEPAGLDPALEAIREHAAAVSR